MSKPARVVSKEIKMAAVALVAITLMATFPMMIPLIDLAIMFLFPPDCSTSSCLTECLYLP
jgi:hypothetical protein